MCKHKMRTMQKPRALMIVAAWEAGFWFGVTAWVIMWYTTKNREEVFRQYIEELGYETDEERQLVHIAVNEEKRQSANGLWANSLACFLFVPLASVLYAGVRLRSRCLIIMWMTLCIIFSFLRAIINHSYSHAFSALKWAETYWLFRIYFLTIAANYCLDLWAEASYAEQLDVPILIPSEDSRAWRGAYNYPDYPMTLDQRSKIYGTGKHTPMHMDWRFVAYPYPGWFETLNENNRPVLVFDNAAYNPDTR